MKWELGEENVTNGDPSHDIMSEDGVIGHFYDKQDAKIAAAAPDLLRAATFAEYVITAGGNITDAELKMDPLWRAVRELRKAIAVVGPLLIAVAILTGCGSGGGGSQTASAPTLQQPPPPQGKQWYELTQMCQEVLPGWFWARFDNVTGWVSVFDSLDNCQHHPLTANPVIKNKGDCFVRSSYLYGSWNFCYDQQAAQANDAWLTVEAI